MIKSFYVGDWALKNGATYQINPRTFSKEGTIKAVTKELPFLADLEFGVMYLCPIFKEDESLDNWSERQTKSNTLNPKNPYRISDYFNIDSEYGTMDDLREFTSECHRLGMSVMLDLVYLHIGPNANIIKSNPDFVQHNEDGSVKCTRWNFPYLNFDNEGLREYLYSNMVYYVSVIGVDGFRCDVGDAVPEDFWAEGRRRIRLIKPEAILLNEGSKADKLGVCFDAMYAFGWHNAIHEIFEGAKDATFLYDRWLNLVERMSIRGGGVAMRDIDNHDTVTDWEQRSEVLGGHDGMELAEVLTFLIDGIPMVYCGNELADTKRISMFANRFYMGDFEATDREDKTSEHSVRRQQIIKKLNNLRKTSETLARGVTRWFETENREQVVAFRRILNGEVYTVIGNMSRKIAVATVENAADEVVMESKATRRDGNKFSFEPFGYVVLRGTEKQ